MTFPDVSNHPEPERQVSVENSEAVAIAATGGTASVTVYGSPPPIDYNLKMRDDVAFALARLESRNVLHAQLNDELWRYVFKSLRELRDVLADTSAKLKTRGPHDVKATLRFMVDAIAAYLAEHDTSYERYMASNGGWSGDNTMEQGWPRMERQWLLSTKGKPADDLLSLRKALDKALRNLNKYAESGQEVEWEEPTSAKVWSRWARDPG